MKRIFACVSIFLMTISPVLALDAGTVQGSLQFNGKTILLQQAYAHLHDNAEGLLDRPKELRILLTDRAVANETLAGIAFLPVEEMARQGQVQGLLLKLDPAKLDNINVTLLAQPAKPEMSLVTQTLSTPGRPVIKDFKLGGARVLGAIEERDERGNNNPNIPAVAYSAKFSAPVFNEPAITADLKGKDALGSPQVLAFTARARAFGRGDFATVKKFSTERANRQFDIALKQQGAQMTAMAKQAGAEMEKQIKSALRVVVRGNRAAIIFSNNGGWSVFAREGGEWKSDD